MFLLQLISHTMKKYDQLFFLALFMFQFTYGCKTCYDLLEEGRQVRLTETGCGVSKIPQCSGLLTYPQAQVFCGNQGLTLCSYEDIEEDMATGTGCAYDLERVWVVDECLNGYVTRMGSTVWDSYPNNAPKIPISFKCENSTDKFPVRCCTDYNCSREPIQESSNRSSFNASIVLSARPSAKPSPSPSAKPSTTPSAKPSAKPSASPMGSIQKPSASPTVFSQGLGVGCTNCTHSSPVGKNAYNQEIMYEEEPMKGTWWIPVLITLVVVVLFVIITIKKKFWRPSCKCPKERWETESSDSGASSPREVNL